jgi:hypothetical protein
MRHERIAGWLALFALSVAISFDVALETPLELCLALVAIGLVTALSSRRFATWLDRPRLSSRLARVSLIVLPVVGCAAVYLGGPHAWDDMGLRGDWPVNEAFVQAIRDALDRGSSFTWSTRIAPGDPTTDLYPTVAHRVLAWISHHHPDLSIHRIVVGAAVVAFTAVAIGVARAARITGAPWLACVIVGLACLYDYGSDFGWGVRATFFWGFFPSTLAMGLWYTTLPSALEALKRPTRARLVLVAIGFGAAAILHPVGLVLSGALVVASLAGLSAVRPLDRARLVRLLVALGAALALTAPVWAPASQRVLDHGVHFGTPPVPIETAAGRMAQGLLPDGSFVVLVLLGWIGVVRAIAVRRAGAAILAIAALFLVSLYIETYFLDLGLAPSVTSVRWQSFRVGTFLKPVLYVLAAHALGVGAEIVRNTSVVRTRWLLRTAALLFAIAAWQLGDPQWSAWLDTQQLIRTHDLRGHELEEQEQFLLLREHLAAERAAIPADRHARLLLFCPLDCPYELMELAWDPGIPLLLHHPAPAGHFLRDQFFDVSPENLRRFGVRWAVAVSRTPPPGDSATQRVFGDLILRDITEWDGTFAHVVEGEGAVSVRVVEGEGFDLEVEGGPARVELGTPYYPRLVASHDGAPVPLSPLPVRDAPETAVDRGERAVVLDLPPGTTRVRATGPLRSDGAGRGLAALAALGLLGIAFARVRRPVAIEAFERRARLWLVSPWPARVSMIVALVVIALVPLTDATSRGLRFGVLFPRPRMHLETATGEHIDCVARSLGRSYQCGDTELAMTVATILQDWHVGWPVPVPAIEVRHAPHRATLVIETDAPLLGEYLGACEGCSGTVERGEGHHTFAGTGARVVLERGGPTVVRAVVRGPLARVSLVRADLVIPPER